MSNENYTYINASYYGTNSNEGGITIDNTPSDGYIHSLKHNIGEKIIRSRLSSKDISDKDEIMFNIIKQEFELSSKDISDKDEIDPLACIVTPIEKSQLSYNEKEAYKEAYKNMCENSLSSLKTKVETLILNKLSKLPENLKKKHNFSNDNEINTNNILKILNDLTKDEKIEEKNKIKYNSLYEIYKIISNILSENSIKIENVVTNIASLSYTIQNNMMIFRPKNDDFGINYDDFGIKRDIYDIFIEDLARKNANRIINDKIKKYKENPSIGRFTNDGNLRIEKDRMLSSTTFKIKDNEIDTIPYVGNIGKNEYPCIGNIIDENSINIVGFSETDVNTPKLYSEMLKKWDKSGKISKINEIDLKTNKKNTIFEIDENESNNNNDNNYTINENKITYKLKRSDYTTSTPEKEKISNYNNKIDNIAEERLKKKGIFKLDYNMWYSDQRLGFNGYFVNNVKTKDIQKWYLKNDENKRKEELKIISNCIEYKNKDKKENTTCYSDYKTMLRNNVNNRIYIEDGENFFSINKNKYDMNGKLISHFYNECVSLPKNKNGIIKVKSKIVSLFHNNVEGDFYSSSLDDKNRDCDGYQKVTKENIEDVLDKNCDNIIKDQKAKNLNFIPIVKENKKIECIGFDEFKMKFKKDCKNKKNISNGLVASSVYKSYQDKNKYKPNNNKKTFREYLLKDNTEKFNGLISNC